MAEKNSIFDAYLKAPDDLYEGSRDIEDGIVISRFPDYCFSPNAVVPYTIWAKQSDDANTAPTVRMTGKRSHTSGSYIIKCHGDEGGTGGGVTSGTHNGVCRPKTWSKRVFIQGNGAVRDTDLWWMNNENTEGRLYYKVNAKRKDQNANKNSGESAEGPANIDTMTTGSITAAVPMDGSGNIRGAIDFAKFRQSAKNAFLSTGNPIAAAGMGAKMASAPAAFLTAFFWPNDTYPVAFSQRHMFHKGRDPNFDAIYNDAMAARESISWLDYNTGGGENWMNYWDSVLSQYQQRALAGDFGPTAQTIAAVNPADTLPREFQERLAKDRVKVVGAATTTTMLPAANRQVSRRRPLVYQTARWRWSGIAPHAGS